jgi:hypothetical protein
MVKMIFGCPDQQNGVCSHVCNTNSAILWKILELPEAFHYFKGKDLLVK